MRFTPLYRTATALVIMTACVAQESAPPVDADMDVAEDVAAAEAAVNAVRDAEAAALNSGDATAGYMSADAVMLPPNQPPVNGIDAIRSWMGEFVEQFSTSVNYTRSDITVSGGLAVEYYEATLTLTPTAGGDPMTDELKGIHVYRRGADGTWSMVYDSWSSKAPPPEM